MRRSIACSNRSEIEQLGLGLGVSVTASAINLIVARVLLREGQARRSITLEADAHHLMTDVWTSAGVIGGVGIAGLTGWHILDPLVAIVVALNIIWTGIRLVSRSVAGLMDAALPTQEQSLIAGCPGKVSRAGSELPCPAHAPGRGTAFCLRAYACPRRVDGS